ncbi:MAG: 16S rRNA (uracil(1498)-N(3))-methyltransferase [Deltaproteobacteria bacterium]|nr:16S rRNA (uracil(1498)-N(3))-methyltransferase [Deltaproteobacteria bacterium]
MNYFLSSVPLALGQELALDGEEARHITSVRRIRTGETLALQGPDLKRFLVRVTAVRPRLAVRVESPLVLPPLPRVKVTLFQGAVKPKAAETIVQKATELGVDRVVFFQAAHSPTALAELTHAHHLERIQRIAWEACKQCGRAEPPRLDTLAALAPCLEPSSGATPLRWLFHPGGLGPAWALANSAGTQTPVHLLVGPEGGFLPEEVALAHQAGYISMGLGGFTLRAETAAIAAATLAIFGLDDKTHSPPPAEDIEKLTRLVL